MSNLIKLSHRAFSNQGGIYTKMIQVSSQIKDYNFREYFMRRAKEDMERDASKTLNETELNNLNERLE